MVLQNTSPPVIFLLTFPRWCFFCGLFLFFVLVFIILSCLFLAALWSSAGKGLTSWLSCVWCFPVFLSHSHMVSWVRCDTWLYWFLIFAFFLTLSKLWAELELFSYLKIKTCLVGTQMNHLTELVHLRTHNISSDWEREIIRNRLFHMKSCTVHTLTSF